MNAGGKGANPAVAAARLGGFFFKINPNKFQGEEARVWIMKQ